MGGEWRETTLGALADIFDGPHATPSKTQDGPVFLGISCLNAGHLNMAEAEHLSEEDFQRWTRRIAPKAGDVVFSYETRLGEAAIIPEGLRCCLGRRMGLLRAKEGKVDPRFLLYAYLGPEFQETLRARTFHGSTVDRIPLITMPDFPIRVPSDLSEQRRIAGILGALDDKIELNRNMNRTLEDMAQAIFKSWFIDFDGHTDFEDSPLGPIPRGWKVVSLSELMEIQGGTQPPASKFISGEKKGYVRLIQIRDYETDAHLTYIPDNPGLRKCTKFDVMIARYGASVGRICWGLEGAYNVALVKAAPTKKYYLEWLRTYLNTEEFQNRLLSMSHRCAQSGFNKQDIASIKVAIPDDVLLKKYNDMLFVARSNVLHNMISSHALEEYRNYILHKLLSSKYFWLNIGKEENNEYTEARM